LQFGNIGRDLALKRKSRHIQKKAKKSSTKKRKMSNVEEEQKAAQTGLQQKEDAGTATADECDRDIIVRISERFEIFTEQVIKKMDELMSMRDMVEQLLHRKTNKRGQDAERKRKERAAVVKQKNVGCIELKGSIFGVKMQQMRDKYVLWAHVGIQFGIMGSYPQFFSWIASDWNHWTFDKKPITRVSNRPHYFSRGIRNEATWTDLFGRETGISERTFFEPIFWDFHHVMLKVFLMMEEMPDWANVQDIFKAHVQVACSGVSDMTDSGMYQFQDKAPFDHMEELCAKVPQYRMMATRIMQAYRHGVAKKGIADPDNDLELVRMGKGRAAAHLVQLQNEASKLTFLWNLRKGALKEEEKKQVQALAVWGYAPQFPHTLPELSDVKTL
jgi:hypothetical protein